MAEGPACATCGQALPDGTGTCPSCETPAKGLFLGRTEPNEAESAPRPPPAFSLIEGYRCVRKLGEGGMSTVYLAEDKTLGRRVAIKLISAALSDDAASRSRFLREARAMATVEHPHVVRIYSYGESKGLVYLVMEYVQGESLADRLRRLGKLTVEESLQVVAQAADALDAAWQEGIVHRDIKPANIMLDARDRVRVADFGLAKSVEGASDDSALTQMGRIVGTPHYLSPEQARGEALDCRSDIYSLGIVLYEMLTGARPFRGATPLAVITQHLTAPLPALREQRTEIPEHVVRLVEQMTQKDAARRPQSYAALREAIEHSGEPALKWTSGSPFRGLAAFDFEHAPVFFGRTRAIEGVLAALGQQADAGRPFVLILGMSGSGKSSLLRAGVLPRLIQPGAVEGVGLWRRAVLRPADSSGDLFDGLAAALMRPVALPELASDGTTARALAQLLRENPKGAAPLIKGGLSQAAADAKRDSTLPGQVEARLALVLDQMEELFTLERITAEERAGFIEAVAALARSGRVFVMATLRSDFYGRCEELKELMALKEGAGQYHLLPPTPAETAQMIRQPARAAGLEFEQDPKTHAGLDDVLRDATLGQPGNLPLLEFALEELYRQRTKEGLLTYSAYATIGGVEGALSRRAEAEFGSLPAAVQSALPDVFGALVRVGLGEEEVFNRRYAALDSFATPESRALVDGFVAARLFVTDRSDEGRAVVSIAHEALLRSWPRLQQWLEENRELLRVRGRVAAAASLWLEKGKPADLLLAEGKPVEEAQPLLAVKGLDLSADERAFLSASTARAQRRRRARRIMNVNSAVLTIGGVAAYTLYLWKVVPTLAAMFHGLGMALPLATQLMIAASNWLARALPLLLAAAGLLYWHRKRVQMPEVVRSGVAPAIAIGVVLLGALISLIALMVEVVIVLPWFTFNSQLSHDSFALRRGDIPDAIGRLHPRRWWFLKAYGPGTADRITYLSEIQRRWPLLTAYGPGFREIRLLPRVDVLLADAYLIVGDDDLARDLYRQTLDTAGRIQASEQGAERAQLEGLGRAGLAMLDAELPRLGIRCLDAVGQGGEAQQSGARVVGVNRGGGAFRAGLLNGDVIRRFDGAAVSNRAALVGELRRRRVGDSVRLEVLRGAVSRELNVRLARALDAFALGCAQGYLEDCASLGTVYERGEGTAIDLARAEDLYRRACDGAEADGCVSLGLLHQHARGVTQDSARARALYSQSCDSGAALGCNNLAVLLAASATAKDVTDADDLLSKACKAGLPEACANRRLLERRGDASGAFLGATSRPYTR